MRTLRPTYSILRWVIFATLMFLILLVLGVIGGGWAFREVAPPLSGVLFGTVPHPEGAVTPTPR
ncbi:MAG UNVERIFIED_CONTAM: hypothetical protein LVT10_15490 [Anaerolineae bacterium]|jgi:hypothetical protein